MKAVISKTIIAGAVAAASLFGTSAQAALFNPFVVQPTDPARNTFTADKITGNYTEVITFNGSNFDVSLLWTAGQFVTGGGNNALLPLTTRLGVDYGLYALYKASGTVSTSGAITTFSFTPGTGSLQLILDRNVNTINVDAGIIPVPPATGTGNFTFINTGDDVVLANGNPTFGSGNLDANKPNCGSGTGTGIDCGSFGSETTFDLTTAGMQFFVGPMPFYTMSFQSGQLNNFSPTGTQTINGSLDVVFNGTAVPEPASLGLLGLGLLGLGVARRRKQS